MIFKSNIEGPNLRPYFKLLDPPMTMQHHDVPSDPDFVDPPAGFWTDDEAAILYTVAKQVGGTWVDIGARFGWTAAHMLEAGCHVILVEPEYRAQQKFLNRAADNLAKFRGMEFSAWEWWPAMCESREWFRLGALPGEEPKLYDGFVIDGNHNDPEPLNDAKGALEHLKPEGVILFHDFIGDPVQNAVTFLMDQGFKAKVYWTPNLVAVCWRGRFVPPHHVGDPAIDWVPHIKAMEKNFNFQRLER